MAKKRTALVLKKEYVGKKVKITIPRMGEVEFNANKANQQEYENYSKIGFAHCFDEVEQVDATPEEVEAFKLAEASKKVVNDDDNEDEDDDNEDEDDDNEDDEDEEEETISDSDSKADLKDEVRPEKPTEEALNAMEWKDLKAAAVAKGMSVGGRTKRETIINFLLGK